MRLFYVGAIAAWIGLGLGGALAANAIVTENQLSGAPQSQWDLAGPGSTTLQGFATDISVNHGSTINFKIQSAASSWRIDIYRLGYYQGNGARLVTTIAKSGAVTQPTPLRDATTGLVDAGNWTVTASWTVPVTAVSGVYVAHLVDNNNSANENHIPFIVRADESTSDIVFQTSDTTWQAYNGWPCGTSVPNANFYGGLGPGAPSQGSGESSGIGRAYKVSYNRPIATRDGCGASSGPQDFLFGAEYSAIYWLEQNGYDVSYIAGVDVARAPAQLTQHKIFTSTGHDEYWDTAARANVQSALKSGLNLIFMSGNEVYWKTRWEPSIDGSATTYRTLVCYKETWNNAPLDPLDASPTWTWTGTWRDPRNTPPADGGQPENALTGTIFAVDGYQASAIQVPYPMTQLRFWRNTPNVSKTAAGGFWTLTQNILGYEWDVAPDNGFSPPGLIKLSSTTQNLTSAVLRDYGTITGAGTVTHNLTMYKDPTAGGLVFGAGTVYWSWGLSSNHDGPTTPVDADVQQATVNVLADMGAQAGSLQAGLVAATKSTDTTPPSSSISTPSNGASFTQGQTVVISGSATDVGGQVAGVQVSVDGGATALMANGTNSWTYSWSATPGTHVIQSRATDDSLNSETPSAGITVNVASAGSTIFGAPSVANSLTIEDGNAVELGVKFSSSTPGTIVGVSFYKNSINSGPHTGELWDAAGNLLATATFTAESPSGWQSVLFATPVSISPGVTYTASYHTNGFYSAQLNYFIGPVTSGYLTAPVSAGVYRYTASPSFPSQTYQFGSYWVDVLFVPAGTGGQPVITSATDATGTVGTPFTYQISATNNPTSYSATGLPAGLSINTTTGLISGTPTVAGITTVSLKASNSSGSGNATLTLTINPSTAASGLSLFNASPTPTNVTINDPNSVELGVKFTASSSGNITGIQFYKGPQNVGTHTVHLWDSAGNLLASATSANETASGWQTVAFASPVAISANTTYVASYHTSGFYSLDGNFFASAYVNAPLTAPASGASGGNGVYAYGSAATFPANTYNASNYWVDVLFTPTGSGGGSPVITSATSATGTVGTAFNYQITATNNPTGFTASGLPGGLSVNATTGLISGTPTTSGTSSVTLTASNSTGSSSPVTLALTINASGTGSSLFSLSSTPAIVTVTDSNSVELGVKFSSATGGSVTTILFYKGPQNVGTHTVHLWDTAGNLLASGTSANETASGWQAVTLTSPYTIAANTTYVASYHSNGFYSVTNNFFAGAFVNGTLTAPASSASGGNGVYAYGSSSSYPANSYNASNYWVDVVVQ